VIFGEFVIFGEYVSEVHVSRQISK